MIQIFKIQLHSFVDVITNSSSELFMTTDKKVIEFFRDVLKLDEIRAEGSYLKLKTVKEFRDDEWVPEEIEDLKDDDVVLILEANSESYSFLYEVMSAMGFQSLNY